MLAGRNIGFKLVKTRLLSQVRERRTPENRAPITPTGEIIEKALQSAAEALGDVLEKQLGVKEAVVVQRPPPT